MRCREMKKDLSRKLNKYNIYIYIFAYLYVQNVRIKWHKRLKNYTPVRFKIYTKGTRNIVCNFFLSSTDKKSQRASNNEKRVGKPQSLVDNNTLLILRFN